MAPSQFLATLGRELWEPMSNVVSMTGFLLETDLTRDQHEMVSELRHSGDKLLRLIRDALDAVEIEAGLVQSVVIPFDLRVLTDETIALLRGFAFKRGMSVECRVHHEVPSRLVGDPGRLRQVLSNLCRHALEANMSGGVVLRVARLHEDARSVTLRFDITFYDAGLMTPGAEGGPGSGSAPVAQAVVAAGRPGLRLEIARRVVAVMGTRVIVEQESGHVHHAWFDLALEMQKEAPAEESSVPPPASLAGKRVLVVDPTEAIRHALAARLERWGCRVAEARQAEDAMTIAGEAAKSGVPFRFVLIDRDLPLMSAHELGAHLRAHTDGKALHLVLLAAVGRRGDLEHAQTCGFDAYLPKPIDWQDLGDALVEIEHRAVAGPAGETRWLVTRHWLAETRRSRTRVLIVEDDAVSVLVTDWTLRRIGYHVVRVNSAGDLRSLLKGDGAPFDVVVLALRLPDGDGLSLAREIRAATPEGHATAIVALGYECTRVERDRCRAEGVDAYLARPVDLGHLCEVVERITRTSAPTGSEAEDAFSNSGHLPSSRRKLAADRDRVALQFEVDTDTGAVLGDGLAVEKALSMLGVESAVAVPPHLLRPEAAVRSEAPPAADVHGPLDMVRLETASMKNPALRTGLLAGYLREARAGLDLVQSSVSVGDTAAIESAAHRLSGMSEAVGAVACAEVFLKLAALGREGSLGGIAPLVARASAELRRVEGVACALSREASAAA
jgi:CheY-like chemotaxis protein/HPt (histidine-containing phosphotransfer) domain-containing protein